ncbi:MAG: ubiquinol-cytochrome c reductase iron-sulfur subunit [Thaumarchaeota archaeon]|nr:ubiquinol-cytochrome c reductase iron-sulfur subunit [Nitrososphaerota archaeon]
MKKVKTDVDLEKSKKKISKREARSSIARFQKLMGIIFSLAALAGIYLLSNDPFLWLVAVSHAYGLIFIVSVEIFLAVLSFLAIKQVYIAGMVWAVLTIALQLGDLLTGPQFKMTIPYFATYLVGLWPWDTILISQVAVIIVGNLGRAYLQYAVKTETYFDMVSRKSRRDFLQITGLIGGLVAIAAVLGIVEAVAPTPTQASVTTTSTTPLTEVAIGNVGQLQVFSPVYFEFPAGYPNVLFKKDDGSVIALSLLCTHVCCQTNFDSAKRQLICPCHGATYDPAGNVIRGPALRALPTVELRIDTSGNIFPNRVSGPSPCSPDAESQY